MDTSITELKGVGQQVASKLRRLQIATIGDLIFHFPRRYDDFSQITPLNQIQPGNVSAKVTVTSVTARYVRRGLHITEAILSDDTGSVKAVWFNQPYRSKQLQKKTQYFVSGTYEFNNRTYSLLNPSLEKASDFPKNTARIVPIYPETKGLKSHTIRNLIAQIDLSSLPLDVAMPYESPINLRRAITMLHFPQSEHDIKQAEAYFAFEELFSVVLAAQMVRAETHDLRAQPIPIQEDALKSMVDSLPFDLTDDQRRVAWRCLQDMQSSEPMNRLIEGDVGSGKTVVAAMLAHNTALNGHQISIMVPTEVLARQHHATLTSMLQPHGHSIELYVGSLAAADKRRVAKKMANGEAKIVVGTHALIQESVQFQSLNLAIVDEQHRFGVRQRSGLIDKSKYIPHLLSMTATPIPRTLALTVFGDLDISPIKQMPAGRKTVQTEIVSPNSFDKVAKHIKTEIAAGRQAFIVYPLVEESETLDAKSATQAHQKLSETLFKQQTVGILHGRMKSAEKDLVMTQFAAREIDILVATTVIEVGVDVPNASIMVVESAERFGLAQIHQLRGRVGRGAFQSYCYLIPSTSQKPPRRLRALETINDGFRLAEFDLEERGPGAIYGASQHGQLDLRFTKLDDPRSIERARELAADFVQSGADLLEYPRLASTVEKYKSITHLN